ncbi:hypothetical protein LFREDSHE_32590 [Shewanella baltica]
MSWFLLVLAGLFEIGWAIGLKYTEGFTFVAKYLYSGVDGRECCATRTRG